MFKKHSLLILLTAFASTSVAQELPDPDGKPASQDKPVKVFILLGQSNMLGFGRPSPADQPGTLEFMIQQKHKYPHLVDDAGAWTERQDVRFVHVMDKRGVPFETWTSSRI